MRNKIKYMWKILIYLVSLVIMFILLTINILAQTNDTTPSGIPLDELEEKVDSFANNQIGRTTPGMAVAIVKDGEIILLKGYGYADTDKQIPVDPENTVFEFGSITKLLVWTSAMQLVEDGKLKLDEDIKNYLPKDFADKLAYEYPITMYDLMHHTAGFEQQPFDWNPLNPETAIVPLDITLIEHQPKQIYKPGEIIAYSNYGASMAGFVIEKITGQKFYDYISENILAPASMSKTSGNPILLDKPQLPQAKATGYMTTGNGNFKKGIWSYLWQYPAGAANGTAEDLGKFLMALMPKTSKTNDLFKETKTVTEMLTQSYRPSQNMSTNAHGFWEHYDFGTTYWHPGNTASFSSFFAFNPSNNFGVAILTNASYAFEPTYGLGNLLLGKEKEIQSETGVESMPSSYDLSGRYMYSMYSEEGYLKPASYLGNLVAIKAIDEKTIEVSSLGKVSTYIQTSPYYYKLAVANAPELYFTQPQLYVELENGHIKRICSGHMMDIIPVSSGLPLIYFWSSAVLFVICALYFIIVFLLMLQALIRSRKNHSDREIVVQNYFLTAFTALGSILVLNNAFILYNLPWVSMWILIHLNPFIVVNYIILCFTILLAIYRVFIIRHLNSMPKQRVINVSTFLFFAILIFLLYNWNLLSLVK